MQETNFKPVYKLALSSFYLSPNGPFCNRLHPKALKDRPSSKETIADDGVDIIERFAMGLSKTIISEAMKRATTIVDSKQKKGFKKNNPSGEKQGENEAANVSTQEPESKEPRDKEEAMDEGEETTWPSSFSSSIGEPEPCIVLGIIQVADSRKIPRDFMIRLNPRFAHIPSIPKSDPNFEINPENHTTKQQQESQQTKDSNGSQLNASAAKTSTGPPTVNETGTRTPERSVVWPGRILQQETGEFSINLKLNNRNQQQSSGQPPSELKPDPVRIGTPTPTPVLAPESSTAGPSSAGPNLPAKGLITKSTATITTTTRTTLEKAIKPEPVPAAADSLEPAATDKAPSQATMIKQDSITSNPIDPTRGPVCPACSERRHYESLLEELKSERKLLEQALTNTELVKTVRRLLKWVPPLPLGSHTSIADSAIKSPPPVPPPTASSNGSNGQPSSKAVIAASPIHEEARSRSSSPYPFEMNAVLDKSRSIKGSPELLIKPKASFDIRRIKRNDTLSRLRSEQEKRLLGLDENRSKSACDYHHLRWDLPEDRPTCYSEEMLSPSFIGHNERVRRSQSIKISGPDQTYEPRWAPGVSMFPIFGPQGQTKFVLTGNKDKTNNNQNEKNRSRHPVPSFTKIKKVIKEANIRREPKKTGLLWTLTSPLRRRKKATVACCTSNEDSDQNDAPSTRSRKPSSCLRATRAKTLEARKRN